MLVELNVNIDEEGDPLRVWSMDHNYPGMAFSTLLGDTVGDDIGVNAKMEILTRETTKGDDILVIAPSGRFEFLMNQQVIDICTEECNGPLHAYT